MDSKCKFICNHKQRERKKKECAMLARKVDHMTNRVCLVGAPNMNVKIL